MNKGKTIYAPTSLLKEVESIKQEDNLKRNVQAFENLIRYSKAGREYKRLLNLDWKKKK